ncbi:MAG: PAS domain S-box protein, partial [Deltaproteobacteria bacterium]|nr:PAS domain S-box protein [Deltaproteobacteria bacterium]
MDRKTLIYKGILDNMSDGVMSLDLEGRIIAFNPAASRILGIKADDVLGRKFAEAFFESRGNDEFNQVVLDALYESDAVQHRVVPYTPGEKTLSLSLTTSFLRDGAERAGVIAVFSDVTEVQRLREEEIRLTEEVKARHRELQEAYLKIEESHRNLGVTLKRVQVIRIVATLLIIAAFLGTGLHFWKKEHGSGSATTGGPFKGDPGTAPVQTVTLTPSPFSSTLSLAGILEPMEVVGVVSPLTGKVEKKFFDYGDRVKQGDVLLKMETSDVEVNLREAEANYMKAFQHLRELQDWENQSEVKTARRSITKAELALENQKRKLEDAERLFKKGIIPESEYDSAREQIRNMELDLQASREELRAVLEKGNRENVKIARLEAENARIKMEDLREQIRKATVSAPVSGVVVLPELSRDDKDVKKVERGVSFQQGQILFFIGDLEGLSVKAGVDEIAITRIRKGQKVTVTGDAFPGISLNGEITHISSQATKEDGAPSFEIKVTIRHLPPEK